MADEKKLSAGEWNKLIRVVEDAEEYMAFNPWPQDCDENWDEVVAAHEDARRHLEAARAELRDALLTAPWGQSGCAFITRRQSAPARGDLIVSLFVNRRLRAACTGRGWLEINHNPESQFLDAKEAGRCKEERYQQLRQELVELLWEEGIHTPQDVGEWKFREGQMGGCFYRPHDDATVSAPGAMTAAWGPDWESERPDSADLFFTEEEEVERRYGR